jgi:hypothetical protein
MDDRGANIDLLFRNGLKDYEVLPPADVWNKIQPAVSKRRVLTWFRAAAAVTIIASLSFLTWILNRDVTTEDFNSYAVLDVPDAQPIRIAESLPVLATNTPSVSTPATVTVPEKAEYRPGIVVSDPKVSYGEIVSEHTGTIAGLTDIISVPEKANVSSVPRNFGIGNTGNNTPEDYSGVKFTERRWSVSAMASPTYYSKMGKGNEEYLRMAATENAGSSYAGGVGFSYKISKRISIQTGIYYSAYGQKIDGVSSFSGFNEYGAKGHSSFEVLTSNGPVHTNNADVFLRSDAADKVSTAFTNDVFDPYKAQLNYVTNSLIQNFSYIQMPVMLRYKLIDRTLDFNLLGGISYDLLIGNTAFAKTDAGRYPIGSTEGLNSLLFSSSFGMGFEYNFSQKISLNFEPTLRYYLNPFNNSVGTMVHPYSIGVFSGFSYKF